MLIFGRLSTNLYLGAILLALYAALSFGKVRPISVRGVGELYVVVISFGLLVRGFTQGCLHGKEGDALLSLKHLLLLFGNFFIYFGCSLIIQSATTISIFALATIASMRYVNWRYILRAIKEALKLSGWHRSRYVKAKEHYSLLTILFFLITTEILSILQQT